MLFYFKVLPEKHQPDKKQVDGHGHLRVFLDSMPGRFHVRGPVDIVKNEEGVFMHILQTLLKIGQ